MKIITNKNEILDIWKYLKTAENEEFVWTDKGKFKLCDNCNWYDFKCRCDSEEKFGSTKKWVCNLCGLLE